MIKHKLITARKERNKTQKDMADLLGMSQSQYQRRESGEIHIFDDEWVRIAQLLGKETEDIKEEDGITAVYNYDNNSGNYSASNNYFINIPETMLKNQQEYIEMLKQRISELEKAVQNC